MREKLMRLLFKREVRNNEEYIQHLLADIKELVEMQDLYEEEIVNLTNENRILGLIIENLDIYNKERR